MFVSHDASRTGAPMVLLNLIKWIRANTDYGVSILLRGGGALEEEFRALGETHVLADACGNPKFVQGVSLIYSNTCTNGAFIEGLPYGTIPIVTHVHELPAVIESYGSANWELVRKQSSHFIACSEAVKAGLLGLGVLPEKLSTIHESIPVAEVLQKAGRRTREQIKAWHGWERYEHIVAACGVADWRKGADLFLRVAQAVKVKSGGTSNILFLWIGIVPPDERGKLLLNDARLLGIEDTIHFLGEESNPFPYLNACDVFCLTSREDPFPLVMLEAAALGKPIVCFQGAGGGEEFSRRGGGVAVPFIDVEGMAASVLDLIQGEKARKKLGKAAARLVAENFDLTVIAPQVLCEIRRFAKKTSAPAFGNVQIYFPTASGYSEESSRFARVSSGRWTRFQFDVPAGALHADNPIRLDPIDRPAVSEIAAISVKDVNGKVLWRARSGNGAVRIGNGVLLSDDRVFRIVSCDSDPYVYITVPKELPQTEPLKLEVWQVVSEDFQKLAITCKALKETVDRLELERADWHCAQSKSGRTLNEQSVASGKPVKTSKTLRFLQKLLKT
ncbi:MAG: glycosyltransferase [Limisphaerales bacterium]